MLKLLIEIHLNLPQLFLEIEYISHNFYPKFNVLTKMHNIFYFSFDIKLIICQLDLFLSLSLKVNIFQYSNKILFQANAEMHS